MSIFDNDKMETPLKAVLMPHHTCSCSFSIFLFLILRYLLARLTGILMSLGDVIRRIRQEYFEYQSLKGHWQIMWKWSYANENHHVNYYCCKEKISKQKLAKTIAGN